MTVIKKYHIYEIIDLPLIVQPEAMVAGLADFGQEFDTEEEAITWLQGTTDNPYSAMILPVTTIIP
ncbi:MAG: hypothetical protein JSS82_18825 [Bacteroidetes bacterium]|nr:hypothetical protein [Bacteroidota bacterium]